MWNAVKTALRKMLPTTLSGSRCQSRRETRGTVCFLLLGQPICYRVRLENIDALDDTIVTQDPGITDQQYVFNIPQGQESGQYTSNQDITR
jgi:hypothetical protein